MVRFLIASLLMVAAISGEPENSALRHRRLLGVQKQKDKMRSCLDANGNKVDLDDNTEACRYTTYKNGSFKQICKAKFADGDDGVCPTKALLRDSSSEQVIDYWTNASVNISLVPKYRLTLTPAGASGTCTCRETFRTKALPGNCGFPEYDEPGGSAVRAGCSDPACNATVCFEDDFCCTNSWDRICVGYAGTLCDD